MRKGKGTHTFPCDISYFEQNTAPILQQLVDRNLEANHRLGQGATYLSTQQGAYIESLAHWMDTYQRMSQTKIMDYQRLQWEHQMRYRHFLEAEHRRAYVITYTTP